MGRFNERIGLQVHEQCEAAVGYASKRDTEHAGLGPEVSNRIHKCNAEHAGNIKRLQDCGFDNRLAFPALLDLRRSVDNLEEELSTLQSELDSFCDLPLNVAQAQQRVQELDEELGREMARVGQRRELLSP
eukprot:NODE_216_length_1176_cov_408.020408_g175_i0.p1 GENE.NODE_216_length_1176_cov_408.020408_g175_i0~~NODE_216_length_1176_cov_408.020408_g175_i0.p1  ORF type:complete len:141 (+),score=25.20 NODE_216_length_1176_cov_408.020408_g175_i0:31-423(+)